MIYKIYLGKRRKLVDFRVFILAHICPTTHQRYTKIMYRRGSYQDLFLLDFSVFFEALSDDSGDSFSSLSAASFFFHVLNYSAY